MRPAWAQGSRGHTQDLTRGPSAHPRNWLPEGHGLTTHFFRFGQKGERHRTSLCRTVKCMAAS
ncbi:hypothetical protein MC885_002217 [Smutsia gigantea]|nr:hypothetical protein MC885_002217 [Smutsia gigantea]